MPCTKKMAQESESASKPSFIHGHLWVTVGVLAGNAFKTFCLPLSVQVHDGDVAISGWLGDESVSHVVQMLRDMTASVPRGTSGCPFLSWTVTS